MTSLHDKRPKKTLKLPPFTPSNGSPQADVYNDPNYGNLKEVGQIEINGRSIDIKANMINTSDKLGSGQYGIVYKCTVSGYPNIHFAYKDIALVLDPHKKKTIVAELEATLKVRDCEFAVKTFCQITSGINLWLIMELMDLSCHDLIRRTIKMNEDLGAGTTRPIPESVVRAVCYSCVQCLDFLKKLNLMHRDVKPSNILIKISTGQVKLGDFGICGKLENSMAKSKIYQYNYLPPERINATIENETEVGYTVKSDIWALGITAYELVSLIHPFVVKNSVLKTWDAIVKEDHPPLASKAIDPSISSEMADFVDSCLHKAPEERPTYPQLLQSQFLLKYESDTESHTNAVREFCLNLSD